MYLAVIANLLTTGGKSLNGLAKFKLFPLLLPT
jgi:hypothetical protein